MKILKDYIAPSVIIIFTLLILFFCRSIPATKLWNGYTSLYVSADCETSSVVKILNELGCSEIIYLENQRVPSVISGNTPEIALSLSGAEKSDYLARRNMYFFDKSSRYKIYYIQDRFEKEASEAAGRLASQGFSSGINAVSSYPWLAILICAAFAVILVLNSDNRWLTGSCISIPVLFSFSMPFYTVAAAVCLFNSAVFLALKVWNREGAVKVLYRNIYVLTFGGASFLIMLLTGIKCGLVFIPVIISTIAVSYLAKKIKDFIDSRYNLQFVNIRSARVLPIINRKSVKCFAFCSICLAGILVFATLSTIIHPANRRSSAKGLLLPAAVGAGSLPDTDDFIDWNWETKTYPYISVNQKPDRNQTVRYSVFSRDKNGLLVSEEKSISFDENFRKESLKEIEGLPYPAVEKMLISQGKHLNPGYVSSSSQTITILTIILLIIAMLVPAVFYVLLTGNKARQEHK